MTIKRTPLPKSLDEAWAYAAKNDRIVPWAPYGQHISLRCKQHPDLRWSTKNIQYIGARSIFYDLMGESNQPECRCSGRDLEPVVPDDWQEHLVPLEICICRCCNQDIQEEGSFRPRNCHACFDARCDVIFGDRVSQETAPCKAGQRLVITR
jgi:hypothetical protein